MNGGKSVDYKNITLFCTPLRFYTETDEELLFQWLKVVSCITKIQGVGRELHLHIRSFHVSREDLLNLIGIFDRYKFDADQLLVFKNEEHAYLFEDE
jgi:hypothetical protein